MDRKWLVLFVNYDINNCGVITARTSREAKETFIKEMGLVEEVYVHLQAVYIDNLKENWYKYSQIRSKEENKLEEE